MPAPREIVAPDANSIASALTPRSISYPDDVRYHMLTDEELDVLATLQRPYQGALALLSAGIAIPAFPNALPALGFIWRGEPVADGAVWLSIFVGALVATITLGVNAFRGKSAAEELLTRIRSRPNILATRQA